MRREVYVRGRAAGEAQSYLEEVWASGHVRAPAVWMVSRRERAEAGARLDAARGTAPAPGPGEASPLEGAMEVGEARFTHKPARAILRMIVRAKREVFIENAYVVLTRPFRKAISWAAARGVSLVLNTNSYATNNLRTVREAYEAERPGLVKLGLELWERRGPGTLHPKTVVVDALLAYLGSFNLDPRSFNVNLESGVIIRDASFAGEVLRELRRVQEGSDLVGKDGALLKPRGSSHRFLRWLAAALRFLFLSFFRNQF